MTAFAMHIPAGAKLDTPDPLFIFHVLSSVSQCGGNLSWVRVGVDLGWAGNKIKNTAGPTATERYSTDACVGRPVP